MVDNLGKEDDVIVKKSSGKSVFFTHAGQFPQDSRQVKEMFIRFRIDCACSDDFGVDASSMRHAITRIGRP